MNLEEILRQLDELEGRKTVIYWHAEMANANYPKKFKVSNFKEIISDNFKTIRALVDRIKEAEEIVKQAATHPSLSSDTEYESKAYLEKWK